MRSDRLCILLSILLLGGDAADYRNPTVTSSPIRVSEAVPQHYQQHLIHQQQQQQQPAVLTQSYQVLPESRNYYQYPQYLPTHTGYTNIQSVGQPYQMYGSAPGTDASSYGLSVPASSSVPSPSPSPSTVPHRIASPTPSPIPPSPFENRLSVENQHSRSPAHHHSLSHHQASSQVPFAPKPILSYGAANPFLANLPPAQGVYGAPVEDSSHRGYDGGSAPSAAPPSSSSVDDTWEALEASLDANTRRRHRFSFN